MNPSLMFPSAGTAFPGKLFFPVSALVMLLMAAASFSQARRLSFTGNEAAVAAAVQCGEVRIERNGDAARCVLPLVVPGASLDYPNDNGLLGGKYATFSLASEDVRISTLNYDGTLYPDILGLPDLPLVRLQVRIPYSARVAGVTAANADFRPLDGEYPVAPIRERLYGSFVRGKDADTRTLRMDAGVFGKNAVFTHPLTFESMICHGIRFLEITYCPFRYNPVTKTLHVANKADIVIDYTSAASSEANRPNVFRAAINRMTFNGTGVPDRAEAVSRGGKFIVVSNSALFATPTYRDYIAYRKSKGFTLADTINADNMTAAAIESKIKSLYATVKMEYVIIIGDETVVPIPSGATGEKYHYKNYSRLEGADEIEDVGLGIFLCNNEEKFRNIVMHQKWHEAGGDWNKTHLATASADDDGDTWNQFSPGHYATAHLDKPGDGLGYTVHRVYVVKNIPTKYENTYVKHPVTPFEPWTLNPSPFYFHKDAADATGAAIKWWNAGVAVISYMDHGLPEGPCAPEMNYSLFSSGAPLRITTTCSPFFTAICCVTGAFRGTHPTNFAYQSQTNRYGTCASLCSTVPTLSGDDDGVHLAMYAALYPKTAGTEPVVNIGQIWLAGHLKGKTLSRNYYHIYGDPMTDIALKPSGAPFVTMAFPNGGEALERNGAYGIAWTDNIAGNVTIELVKDGSAVKTLGASVPSTGSFDWTIGPDIVPAAGYKIKVTSLDNPALSDQSDNAFSISEEFVISKFPYSESFDFLHAGSAIVPAQWEQAPDNIVYWMVWKGKTPSKLVENGMLTGPDGDHTSGQGNYLYVEASSPTYPGSKAAIVTPEFDISKLDDPKLTFWYHMYCKQAADQMGTLSLDINANGSWKNDVFHTAKNQGDAWKRCTVSIAGYKTGRVAFRFRAVTGSGSASDICIDDVSVASSGTQAVEAVHAAAPENFGFSVAGSRIAYRVPANRGKSSRVTIALYTLMGKQVMMLYAGPATAGTHHIQIDKNGRRLARGLYRCRMEADGYAKTASVFLWRGR